MVKRAKTEKKALKDKLPPIHCKGCNISFIPKDHRQRYHSDNCREDYYNRVFFGKTTARKVCPNCEKEFSTTKPGRQDYCTPDCRDDARRKRLEGVSASVTAEKKTFLGDRFAALERGDFKCSYCGKSPRDGVKLDVEDDKKGGLRTVCNICREGREFNTARSAEA